MNYLSLLDIKKKLVYFCCCSSSHTEVVDETDVSCRKIVDTGNHEVKITRVDLYPKERTRPINSNTVLLHASNNGPFYEVNLHTPKKVYVIIR